jgi:hypothetical protein
MQVAGTSLFRPLSSGFISSVTILWISPHDIHILGRELITRASGFIHLLLIQGRWGSLIGIPPSLKVEKKVKLSPPKEEKIDA